MHLSLSFKTEFKAKVVNFTTFYNAYSLGIWEQSKSALMTIILCKYLQWTAIKFLSLH